MENADPTIADRPAPVSHSLVVVRALASAALFGALGGWLGKWLGRHGSAKGSDMAQPIMQWGMGLFSATLAAYSSLKVSAQETMPQQQPREGGILLTDAQADKKIPLTMIEAQGRVREGEVAPVLEKQRG